MKKLLLYAPTFREDYRMGCYRLDYFALIRYIKLRFGGSVQVRFASETGNNLFYFPFQRGIMDTAGIKQLGWKAWVGLKDMFRWTMDSFMVKYNGGE